MLKEDGPRPKHCVIVLVDGEGNVGYVGVRRLDQPAPWRAIWQHRMELDSPLARWLQALDNQPTERILVGSVGMHGRTARAVVALVAGWFGQANPASNVGGQGTADRADRAGWVAAVLAVACRSGGATCGSAYGRSGGGSGPGRCSTLAEPGHLTEGITACERLDRLHGPEDRPRLPARRLVEVGRHCPAKSKPNATMK